MTPASPIPRDEGQEIRSSARSLQTAQRWSRASPPVVPMARGPDLQQAPRAVRKTSPESRRTHTVIVDGDAAAAEIDDKVAEVDRGFARGNDQHEHRKDLPRQIAQRGAERHEVDISRPAG